MAKIKDYICDDANYLSYLNKDGKKHEISSHEESTNYWNAFYNAYTNRFKPEYTYLYDYNGQEKVRVAETKAEPEVVDAPAEAVAPVEVVEKKPCCKCKKRYFPMILTLIFSAAFIALLAISYFGILPEYTYLFANGGTKQLVDIVMSINPEGMAIGDIILAYAVPGTAALAAVFALLTFIFSIVTLAAKKRINVLGAFSLVGLILWLACGILMFFAAGVQTDTESIIAYINPLVSTGVIYGYYIGAALLLLCTIFGFVSYGKKCKK